MDLNSIDLNLLKFLDALAQERSVTRAGLRLGLSQPAASRALGRQGHARRPPGGAASTGWNSRPGPAADRPGQPPAGIRPRHRFAAVLQSGHGLAATPAAHDHLALLIVPGLMARFARLAPGLDLDIAQPAGDNVRRVADGAADLAVGVFDALPASLYRRALRPAGLRAARRSSRRRRPGPGWLPALRHIVVTISGVGASPVDAALSARGLTRRVALRVPTSWPPP